MIPLISAAFEFVIQCFKWEKILLLYQARRLAVRAWRFGQSRFTIGLQRSGLQWNEGCHGKRGILVFSEWVRSVHVSSEWVRSVHVSSEWVRCTCIQWVSEVYMCPVSEWVSEVYMCSVSEWGVHVSTEWVRCTCVQWVSDLKRTEWLAYLNKWNKGKIDGMIDWWTGYTHQLTDWLSNWLIECLTDWWMRL